MARGAGVAAGVLRRAHVARDRNSVGRGAGVLAVECGAAGGSAAEAYGAICIADGQLKVVGAST